MRMRNGFLKRSRINHTDVGLGFFPRRLILLRATFYLLGLDSRTQNRLANLGGRCAD